MKLPIGPEDFNGSRIYTVTDPDGPRVIFFHQTHNKTWHVIENLMCKKCDKQILTQNQYNFILFHKRLQRL